MVNANNEIMVNWLMQKEKYETTTVIMIKNKEKSVYIFFFYALFFTFFTVHLGANIFSSS